MPLMMPLHSRTWSRTRHQVGTRIGIERGVALQFSDQHRNGRQRRAQFVRGAGGQGAQRHHALVAQRLLARGGEVEVAFADRAVMRATNQAIITAETTKVSHMPARCRRAARATSSIAQRQVEPGQQRVGQHRQHVTTAVSRPGSDSAATATGTSSSEISGLAAPPER
jgi:hypothetical protein